jgi:hypothetical protein
MAAIEKYVETTESDVEKVSGFNTIESPPSTATLVQINESKLIRKIDLSILPILFCAYFLQFMDKVIYNASSSPLSMANCMLMRLSMQMSWAYRKTFI